MSIEILHEQLVCWKKLVCFGRNFIDLDLGKNLDNIFFLNQNHFMIMNYSNYLSNWLQSYSIRVNVIKVSRRWTFMGFWYFFTWFISIIELYCNFKIITWSLYKGCQSRFCMNNLFVGRSRSSLGKTLLSLIWARIWKIFFLIKITLW